MPENSWLSLPSTNKAVILDIGTGDGHYVYQMARKNPDELYIGIDASSEKLVKISEKIYRNPKKGGANNALFLKASAEALPVTVPVTTSFQKYLFQVEKSMDRWGNGSDKRQKGSREREVLVRNS